MTTQYKFDTLTLIGTRPAGCWPDAIIFNAPRPLYGTFTWVGDFCCGTFYAIVNPDDPYRAGWIKENCSLAATVLLYTDEATARQQVRQYLADEGYTDVSDELFEEYWIDSFYTNFARGEIVLEVDNA